MRDYDSEQKELIELMKKNCDPEMLKIAESINQYSSLYQKTTVYNVSIQENNNVK